MKKTKKQSFNSQDYNKAIELGDQYLLYYIKTFNIKSNVSLFILGHAIELYCKALYYKSEGTPIFSHETYNILNKLRSKFIEIDEVCKSIEKEQLNSPALNIIFNHIKDLKYIGYIHMDMPKIDNGLIWITDKDYFLLSQYLYFVLMFLDYNREFSPLVRLINDAEQDFKEIQKNGGFNRSHYRFFSLEHNPTNMGQGIIFLKRCFDKDYIPKEYPAKLFSNDGKSYIEIINY